MEIDLQRLNDTEWRFADIAKLRRRFNTAPICVRVNLSERVSDGADDAEFQSKLQKRIRVEIFQSADLTVCGAPAFLMLAFENVLRTR